MVMSLTQTQAQTEADTVGYNVALDFAVTCWITEEQEKMKLLTFTFPYSSDALPFSTQTQVSDSHHLPFTEELLVTLRARQVYQQQIPSVSVGLRKALLLHFEGQGLRVQDVRSAFYFSQHADIPQHCLPRWFPGSRMRASLSLLYSRALSSRFLQDSL